MANNQFIKIKVCTVKTAENIVVRYIRVNNINKSKLAKKLGMKPQNLQGRLATKSLNTDFIEQLADSLNHDFFADLSKDWQRKHFDIKSIVEEPATKYGAGTLDALIEKIVERKINEKLIRK